MPSITKFATRSTWTAPPKQLTGTPQQLYFWSLLMLWRLIEVGELGAKQSGSNETWTRTNQPFPI
jgi:hypothetical protein